MLRRESANYKYRVTVESMNPNMRRMWQILPGRHWPMLPDQEKAFVDRMTELAKGRKSETQRDDLIILLTALRCGTDADLLLENAPGTTPESILAAYNWIEKLRQRSVSAWIAIENAPSIATVQKFAPEAVKVLPIPVRRIVSTIEGITNGTFHARMLPESIGEASAQIHRLQVRAHGFESELESIHYNNNKKGSNEMLQSKANDLGQRLYDPLAPGIYGDAYFLPNRVSTLSPLRVRDLLGERHIHTQLLM